MSRLEFANAQLLELRVYDAVLDAELPVMYDHVSEARCRATSWRLGIERKREIVRSMYAMLNGEAQTARAELLELAVALLIVMEPVLSIIRH